MRGMKDLEDLIIKTNYGIGAKVDSQTGGNLVLLTYSKGVRRPASQEHGPLLNMTQHTGNSMNSLTDQSGMDTYIASNQGSSSTLGGTAHSFQPKRRMRASVMPRALKP